jgi:guanylate kinase
MTLGSDRRPDRRGLCFILSSPSGAGKTTLARLLLKGDPKLRHSVSVTTRPPRAQERDGEDYHFISRERFEELKAAGELLEWAEVFGNFYGTPAATVRAALSAGEDVLFDVDWQGAAAIARLLPTDTVRVFILPPSGAELTRRIYARATDPEQVIRARLKSAAEEMSHWAEYDYVLVNRDIEECVAALRTILAAERLRRHRQLGLAEFIGELAGDGRPPRPDPSRSDKD